MDDEAQVASLEASRGVRVGGGVLEEVELISFLPRKLFSHKLPKSQNQRNPEHP